MNAHVWFGIRNSLPANRSFTLLGGSLAGY
jgi:hypothetical protein